MVEIRYLHVTVHVLQIVEGQRQWPWTWPWTFDTRDLNQGNSFSLKHWLQLFSWDRLQPWATCCSLPLASQCAVRCRPALRVLWLVVRGLSLRDERISRFCTASGLQFHFPWRSISEQARALTSAKASLCITTTQRSLQPSVKTGCINQPYNADLKGIEFDDTLTSRDTVGGVPGTTTFRGKIYRSPCPDCLVMTFNIASPTYNVETLTLYSKRRQVEISELRQFNDLVSCLEYPDARLLDPTIELCPITVSNFYGSNWKVSCKAQNACVITTSVNWKK